MPDDQLTDGFTIDIADDDDRHQIGTIPVAIKPKQLITLRVLDDVRAADRRTVRIT